MFSKALPALLAVILVLVVSYALFETFGPTASAPELHFRQLSPDMAWAVRPHDWMRLVEMEIAPVDEAPAIAPDCVAKVALLESRVALLEAELQAALAELQDRRGAEGGFK